MKPKLLKIKGLNSFVEEQEVDFELLMEHGLFGIFGPTGSGKSTILDAITLALYGEIPRCAGKGLSGVINTDADSVYVYFEFEIGYSSSRQVYYVERIVKRTKAGGTSTGTAIVCDITNEHDKRILGEKVTSTNEILRDIIGLNASDFMKSVVLPQGSFSEFLKLDGKPRREMLERIFGLEEYGFRLSEKASTYQKEKIGEMQRLEGQLSSFEEIKRQDLDNLRDQKKQLENQIHIIKEEYDGADKLFEKYRDVWSLQQELGRATIEYDKQKEQKDVFLDKEYRLDRGSEASNLKPSIVRLNKIEETLLNTRKSKLKSGEQLQILTDLVRGLESKLHTSTDKKENVLPDLIIARENLVRGVKLFNDVQILEGKSIGLDNEIKIIQKNLDGCNKNKNEIKNLLGTLVVELDRIRGEEQKFTISPSDRQNIQEGYNLEKEYNRLLKEEKDLEKNKQSYIRQANKGLIRLKEIEDRVKKQEQIMIELQRQRDGLEKKSPGDMNDLLTRQSKLNELKDDIKKAETVQEDIGKTKERILELSNRGQKYSRKMKADKDKHVHEMELLAGIEAEIGMVEDQNKAVALAKGLEEGIPCPVCGSLDHPELAYSDEKAGQVNLLDDDAETVRKRVQHLHNQITINEVNLKSINEQIEEEQEKLSHINDRSSWGDIGAMKKRVQEMNHGFDQFKAELDKWNKDLKDINKAIEEANVLLSTLRHQEVEDRTILTSNNNSIEEIEERCQTNKKLLKKTYKAYEEIQSRTSIKDFGRQMEDALRWDKAIETLAKEKDKITKTIEDNNKVLDELNTSSGQLDIEIAKLKENRWQMASKIHETREEIHEVSGKGNPRDKLEETEKHIRDINDQWKRVKENWDRQNKLKQEKDKEYNIISDRFKSLDEQQRDEAHTLSGLLAEKGFIDRETALEYLLTPEEAQKLEKEIKKYNSNINALNNRISDINEKLQGDSIGDKEWEHIRDEVVRLKNELQIKRETLIKVDVNIQDIKLKLVEKLKLLTNKKALKKQLDHINQLMYLIRGKRFVDFVAKNQLQYIARSASTRLKEITRGRYALELDAEGNFIIRDDFNGGARRPTHTLSGGETFVTSLALALALSSRIQLGKSTLDFFFLDEGFGSLDADLLDVVMSSLEQLRSHSMCVGLISHIEELKQRLPRKLIVSPAISGERGTLVTMD
ncbi:MAG TPA: AAA family ATPase [Clostridia bacterium]|nr:AAA family ATPase [Clostridia bacterium]